MREFLDEAKAATARTDRCHGVGHSRQRGKMVAMKDVAPDLRVERRRPEQNKGRITVQDLGQCAQILRRRKGLEAANMDQSDPGSQVIHLIEIVEEAVEVGPK